MIGVGKGLETPKASRSEMPKVPSAESVEGIGNGEGVSPLLLQPTGESHELPAGVRAEPRPKTYFPSVTGCLSLRCLLQIDVLPEDVC